jgi:tRNA threonylcarbamoyl adenosine modification protein (Sua5/YciO/YrdC/YwlC family)
MSISSNKLIPSTDEGISQAADLLCAGKLVAFPTETVYGLGANALDPEAVKSIFIAKGRPLTDPLIVHVVGMKNALKLVDFSYSDERRAFVSLGNIFWPGPLTMIVKAAPCVPLVVTAGTGFVGIRYPAHNIAARLLERCNIPIAAPSANRFGHVSPTCASHVLADLGTKDVAVLNGESSGEQACEHGIESTVLKIDANERKVIIFRQGAISKVQIEKALAEIDLNFSVEVVVRRVDMHSSAVGTEENQDIDNIAGEQAPGQAITHYAPDVPSFIVSEIVPNDSESPADFTFTLQELSSIAIIDFNGQLSDVSKNVLYYKDLSFVGSVIEAARNLFSTLREAEEVHGVTQILLPYININLHDISNSISSSNDIAPGLSDRIYRAASGRLIRCSFQLI